MPELPEAETIVNLLKSTVLNQMVITITGFDAKFQGFIDEQKIEQKTKNKMISGLRRAGKALILELNDSLGLLIQLGMTGNMFLCSQKDSVARFERYRILLNNGKGMAFNDLRKFGKLILFDLNDPKTYPGYLKTLGLDPLSRGFQANYLFEIFKGRKASVKDLLLDQRIVAGVGNIYASEALYIAGINPADRGGSLSETACARLVKAIKFVLKMAIRAGGTTISNYRDPEGKKGRFVFSLKVYGRAGDACYRCATDILKIRQSNRSTYYCPSCQRQK